MFKAYRCRSGFGRRAVASEMYKQALGPAADGNNTLYFAMLLDDGATCAFAVMRGPRSVALTTKSGEDSWPLHPARGGAPQHARLLSRGAARSAAVRALLRQLATGIWWCKHRVWCQQGGARLHGGGETLRCPGADFRRHAEVKPKPPGDARGHDGRNRSVEVTLRCENGADQW